MWTAFPRLGVKVQARTRWPQHRPWDFSHRSPHLVADSCAAWAWPGLGPACPGGLGPVCRPEGRQRDRSQASLWRFARLLKSPPWGGASSRADVILGSAHSQESLVKPLQQHFQQPRVPTCPPVAFASQSFPTHTGDLGPLAGRRSASSVPPGPALRPSPGPKDRECSGHQPAGLLLHPSSVPQV